MPVIKSAIKKLRRDRKREKLNDELRSNLKFAIRHAKKETTSKNIDKAVSLSDKAAKVDIIHKRKAARIKSVLNKLSLSKKRVVKIGKKTKAKTSKKIAKKR